MRIMIEAFPDQDAAAQAAAAAIENRLTQAIATRGQAAFVGTGGRSPGPVYDRLSRAPLDWSRVTVTLSDDRCVPQSDPASNARLVRERLLIDAAATATFAPLWTGEMADDAAIRALLPFDVVLLGMGEDGHIASLIPGDPGLDAAMDPAGKRLLAAVPAGLGSPPLPRVTLTLAALLAAREILVLISGEAKRDVVTRAAAGADYPVAPLLLQPIVPVRILWSS